MLIKPISALLKPVRRFALVMTMAAASMGLPVHMGHARELSTMSADETKVLQ
jgi:hypothetical protein